MYHKHILIYIYIYIISYTYHHSQWPNEHKSVGPAQAALRESLEVQLHDVTSELRMRLLQAQDKARENGDKVSSFSAFNPCWLMISLGNYTTKSNYQWYWLLTHQYIGILNTAQVARASDCSMLMWFSWFSFDVDRFWRFWRDMC